ncbi:SDR family NAD(P)-dependent oxidoreductase [Ruania alba]|uniref:3-oxoacyl-[acyl-carrier protein] reductase n=1 Tax=Ruania alba TaxID=648782 RepID=A0A1H5CYL2_9MICO|nr:SDR family NAD(P)-dependent oxidoreductase [Ruania alba]SED71736.1 3-oxoacyl-[acyl-carrier protein] reductase [Ruania alba]
MTRRAVVTGGVSGLGAATAERLAADGVEIITVDIADSADVVLDISDAAAVREAAERIGAVDILINSAGIVGPNIPFWEVDDAAWKRTFAVNVDGTFNVCRAFAPAMIESGWGRIVNFASMAGKDGNPNMIAYSATKAAVIGMTKTMGKDLAQFGVLVNAIAPAVVSTPMNAETAPDVLAHITSLIPMKRVGRADEVAELVAWLASDRCSFSTGAVYDISGGRATY